MSPFVRVYLGLGSNQDPERHFDLGLEALRSRFGEVVLSPLYRSPAVGFDGADFLNAVAHIDTDLSVRDLKAWLTDLENRHGRDRQQPRYSDRTLDIDILLYGNACGLIDGLNLPRSEILEQAYVLRPLAELAPDLIHPATGRSMAAHWAEFERTHPHGVSQS